MLLLFGCGKSDKPPAFGGTVEAIDASRFRPAFASAAPDLQATVNKVMMSIQASALPQALDGLDKLASAPDLSPEQKKVVNDLTEQLKNKMAAIARSSAQ
jgi:hypothetical protein